MQTPLGSLRDLDLSDHEVCRGILEFDKHQLVEGLVFESFFDQYLMSLPEVSAGTMHSLGVDTAVVRLPRKTAPGNGDLGAFVWARSKVAGLGRYVAALSARMPVWLVEYDEADGEFLAAPMKGRRRQAPRRPLQELAASVGDGRKPVFEEVSRQVRDRNRINQSFWGYLSERHAEDLSSSVVLPRIFLNWGIQPWFRYVWNVDRIFLHNEQLWHLEIKHKFPMHRDGPLSFGMNNGELRLIGTLTECGLRSFHAIIVKPFWDKSSGSMYLLNDLKARAQAAVIGREVTPEAVRDALSSRGGISGAHTSFGGRSKVAFRPFPASSFHRFGLLGGDHTQVARRIFSHMTQADQPACQDSDLRRLRLKPA
jgi:hypothetical protein